MARKLTKKAQAAWQKIDESRQERIRYYSYGGAILNDGTKIHSHTISSLHRAGLLAVGNRGFEVGHAPWDWIVVRSTNAAA